MPTEHKKKSKKDEKKPLVTIKNEPDDLKSLEHYVDDKVELIRQIFSSLKSKTIQSITPDFLQKKLNEEIQELCLEELLGISKKRLLSIINATKCPPDTESSDSDSDLEKIEEHISLEEISSDSNDELRKPKKKKKRSTTSKENTATTEKNSEQQTGASENGKSGEKQYSVLELLELQARARAIRSQLALEPVTKIELDDSDDGQTSKAKEKFAEKAQEKVADGESGIKANPSTGAIERPRTESESQETKGPSTRPVRLKRNFRQRQTDIDESEAHEEAPKTVAIPENEKPAKSHSPEKSEETKSVEPTPLPLPPLSDDHESAQHDDDIIPIIQEPEILCITSSDSENEDAKFLNKVKNSYITMPVLNTEPRQPTEDELFLQKIKEKSEETHSKDDTKDKTVTDSDAALAKNSENDKIENNKIIEMVTHGKGAEIIAEKTTRSEEKPQDEFVKPIENDEIGEEQLEDGEIVEEEEIFEIAESSDDESATGNKKDGATEQNVVQEADTKSTDNISIDNTTQQMQENEESRNSVVLSYNTSDAASTSESDSDEVVNNSEEKTKSQINKKSNVDDDDEDIIDLGKDEYLDFDLKTVSDDGKLSLPDKMETGIESKDTSSYKSTRKTRSRAKIADKEGRDSSTETEPRDESWDKRWLRGNKVTKVLATAKLANKVRSKIKEKRTKNAADIQKQEEQAAQPEPVIEQNASNIEVGSVEHYKELTKKNDFIYS